MISSQCGMSPEERERRNKFAEGIAVALHTESRPLQLKDREPTDAEILSALQFALNDEDHQLKCEDQEREENEIPYRLRDEGRASSGMGESYAERNA